MEGLSNRQPSLQPLLDLNETNAESPEYKRDPKFELQGLPEINKQSFNYDRHHNNLAELL